MKFEILKENFKKAVGLVERVARKTTALPALQGVLIKVEGNFLELTATNLETTVKTWVLAKIGKQGSVLAPAGFLASVVNLFSAEKIEGAGEDNNLVLVSQDQETQIQCQNPEEFPIVPKVEAKNTKPITVHARALAEGLAQIMDIPSQSPIRPAITGVYFSLQKNKMKIVATDSFRLAEKTISLGADNGQEISFIVPQASARELASVLSPETGTVNVVVGVSQVLFEVMDEEIKHAKTHLISRLIDGDYPNYQEIVPKKSEMKIQARKDDFANQIKKAGLFSGRVAEVKITVLQKEQKIKIFSQSAELGRSESFMPCQISGGKETEIAFNHKFLADGLNSIKGSEVVFELSSKDEPGVLRGVGDDSYFYILMPIKSS